MLSKKQVLSVVIVVVMVLAVRILFWTPTPRSAGRFTHASVGMKKLSWPFPRSSDKLEAALKKSFKESDFECTAVVNRLCTDAPAHVCEAIDPVEEEQNHKDAVTSADKTKGALNDKSGKKDKPKKKKKRMPDLLVTVRPSWNMLQWEAAINGFMTAYNVSLDDKRVAAAFEENHALDRDREKMKIPPKIRNRQCKFTLLALEQKNDFVMYRQNLGKAHWSQRYDVVSKKPYSPVTHPEIAVNSLCGPKVGGAAVFDPLFDESANFLIDKESTAKALKANDRRLFYNHHEELLVAHNADGTTHHRESACEGVLMKKLSIWRPLNGAQPDKSRHTALQILMRPTLLCITVTSYDGLELALLQHLMWGRNCDDHLIFLGIAETGPEAETARKSIPSDYRKKANAVGMSPDKIIDLDPQELLDPEERHNRWQRLRSVMLWLDSEQSLVTKFNYVMLVDENTYVIPENIYALTLRPEMYFLNSMGTPLLLGNRMVLPKEKIPYIAGAGGILMNAAALNLLTVLQTNVDCFLEEASNAEDVLLASCLANYGVIPRDTSDEAGQDRFHPMSPEWLIRLALNPSSSWWYSSYRPRPLPAQNDDLFTTLSSSSVSFGGINSIPKAVKLHGHLWD